ncbi:hypothetical protein V6W11_27765 [Micromonospora profundi]|uniref:hypothetical protein n=1 Tax=Micromonospora TaxID=1873 RepID=UPI0012FCBE79|nr:hypothetical protein [Micromonospora sp. NRRL B-16802]
MRSIKIGLFAVLSSALFASSIALSPTAQASTQSASCAGTHVANRTVSNAAGTVIGRVGIYRDGNYACAIGVKAGGVYGVPTYTSLIVYSQSGADSGSDSGQFLYQTNAIRVYAPAHYILVDLLVTTNTGAQRRVRDTVYF